MNGGRMIDAHTAALLERITDKMIVDRLLQVEAVSVEWSGRLPRDAERWDGLANAKLPDVGVAEVREQLDRHSLGADTELELIDMAISMACEPDEMPDGGCVSLYLAR